MLFLFAYHIVFTDYAWGVWGLLVCSFLSTPFLSFGSTLALTLVLPLVIVVGSLVGSPVGFDEFEVNSGCFSLLMVVIYWWLVYLLPLLGHQALSLILAPTWLPNNAYCQGHMVHTFPQHRQKFGVFVTYSTHVIVLIFVRSLLSVTPPHPINELIVMTRTQWSICARISQVIFFRKYQRSVGITVFWKSVLKCPCPHLLWCMQVSFK